MILDHNEHDIMDVMLAGRFIRPWINFYNFVFAWHLLHNLVIANRPDLERACSAFLSGGRLLSKVVFKEINMIWYIQ